MPGWNKFPFPRSGTVAQEHQQQNTCPLLKPRMPEIQKKCTTSNKNHPSSKPASKPTTMKRLDFRGRAAGMTYKTHVHACLLKGIHQQLKIEPEIFQAGKTWAPISLISKPWSTDMFVLGVNSHLKEPLAHLRCWFKIQKVWEEKLSFQHRVHWELESIRREELWWLCSWCLMDMSRARRKIRGQRALMWEVNTNLNTGECHRWH